MGATTMWILSYSLVVLLALGAGGDDDIATVYAYSPGSNGGYPGLNNPSQSMQEVKQSLYNFYDVAGPVSKDTVKWGYDAGSQAGSSGTTTTSEKPDSESYATSQQGFNVGSPGSGSLVYGSVGNAVRVGMSGYDSSQLTNFQGSGVVSSSVLTPLHQSRYSVKPVQVVSPVPLQISSESVAKPSSQQLVQTISQSSSEQPANSGTMVQSSPLQSSQPSGQHMSQTSFQSAVPSGRWPIRPLKGKPHKTGSRPVHNAAISSSKPSKVSQPSLPILQYGSVPSSLAVASYELVSPSAQSSGQTVNQPSILQNPNVIDVSVVQPSSQPIQQAVDASVAQSSSQQVLQASQSVSQSNIQLVDGVLVAQPSGLAPLKHHKGKPHFGSTLSSTSPHQTLSLTSVGQSSSQIPVQISYLSGPQPALQLPVQASYQSSSPPKWQTLVQASYQSEAQSASQKPGQTSYQSVPQPTAQQTSYQSVSQSNGQQLVQASYQSEAQSASQHPGQTSFKLVAKPSVQQPAKVSFSAAPLALQQPALTNYQLVAPLGVQQPASVSSSVAQPSHLQAAQSSYEYVVKQNGQTLFKPVQSHGIHQIGSKLYSCHELPQPSYQRRHHSPSIPSLPTLAQDIKPVVLPSDPIPVDPIPTSFLTSTFRPASLHEHPSLQSVVLQSEQPGALEVQPSYLTIGKPGPVSYSFVSQPTGHPSRPLQQPGYQPPAKILQDVFWPLVKPNKPKPSSFEAQFLPSQLSSVSGQFVSQPQMLPSSLSLAQSGSSPALPVQSSYQPQVVSSYETAFQPVLQTSSVVVPSSYQSTSSSQAWSSPLVSSYESVLQSVQPDLPAPVNYQSVTDQNAAGPAENSRHSSGKLLKLLQQVKS